MLNTNFDFINAEYRWLDTFIHQDLGATYGICPNDVMLNLANNNATNRNYLGTYFPRTCAEYFSIMDNLSQHGVIYKKFASCKSLNLLSIGTGTGGEIVGIILFIAKIRSEDMPKINVSYVEGNKNASQLFETVIAKVAEHYDIQVELNGLNHTVGVSKDFPSFDDQKFDLIVTSKFINELVNCYPQKKWYKTFLESYTDNLSKNGMMVMSDVTMPVHHEFLPISMNKEIKEFLKSHDDFNAILPVPCRVYGRKCRCNCFTQAIVQVRTSESWRKREIMTSKFTFTVITRAALSNTFNEVPRAMFSVNPRNGICQMASYVYGDAINAFDIVSVAV